MSGGGRGLGWVLTRLLPLYAVLYLVFLYLPILFLPLFSFNDPASWPFQCRVSPRIGMVSWPSRNS
ncbi:MAG: hypothetical protein R3D84_16985 [Paracoccaceae bacterium]